MRYGDLREFSAFLSEFQHETDRGAALVGAATIDQRLGETLKAFMIDAAVSRGLIDSVNAPLGTFSARIKMSHALGLIDDDEAHECGIIRKVRNEFAHSIHGTSFETHKIKRLCQRLKSDVPGKPDDFVDLPRLLFVNAVVTTALRLVYRAEWVARHRRTATGWPY